MFYKKGVLKNFAKFTGKHTWQSPFSNKLTDPTPAPVSKKKLWHRCFPVDFAKFVRAPFFIEHLGWLQDIVKHNYSSANLRNYVIYSCVLFSLF